MKSWATRLGNGIYTVSIVHQTLNPNKRSLNSMRNDHRESMFSRCNCALIESFRASGVEHPMDAPLSSQRPSSRRSRSNL